MSPTTRPPHLPGWLILLGMVIAIGPLSIDMYLPGLPTIADDLGVSRGAVERSLAAYLVGSSLGQLAYGPMSDRFGRRPPLFFGLGIYIAACIGCFLARNVESLIFWRFMQAVGGSAGMVIARAVVRDRLGPQDSARAFSALMLVMGLAPILAPMAGGWVLGAAGWRAIFGIQAAFALFCVVAIAVVMSETRPVAHIVPLRFGRVAGDYVRLLGHRPLMVPTLCGGFAMAGMFAYISGSPFILIKLYDIDPGHYGAVFGLNAFGFIGLAQVNAYWLGSISTATLLRRAIWAPPIAGLVLLALTLLHFVPLPVLMLCLFAYVGSIGCISPNTTAIALASQGRAAGAASALMGAVQGTLGTLAGLAVSFLPTNGVLPLAGVLSVCGVMVFVTGRIAAREAPAHVPLPPAAEPTEVMP